MTMQVESAEVNTGFFRASGPSWLLPSLCIVLLGAPVWPSSRARGLWQKQLLDASDGSIQMHLVSGQGSL